MTRKLTAEIFIERAKTLHNNLYDYSHVKYINGRVPVNIICSNHGMFAPTPENHLNKKSGCPTCVGLKKRTTQEFVDKAGTVHNLKYDYSKVEYKNNHTHIIIVCPKHGDFIQVPASHLAGHGCQKCTVNISKSESAWLDAVNVPIALRQYKITVGTKKYIVDGYNPDTRTVYEFLGDYWHGNPSIYAADLLNSRKNITFGELYRRTKEKHKVLEMAGYNIIEMWEKDFKDSV
jgi:hypothetical protein